MRPSAALAILLLSLIAATRAEASLMLYTLTDLGPSPTRLTYFDNVGNNPSGFEVYEGGAAARLAMDAAGDITGVSNSSGTLTYAFNKSPVSVTYGPVFDAWQAGQFYTLSGTDYSTYTTTFHTLGGTYSVSTYRGAMAMWDPITEGHVHGLPIDANIHGQILVTAQGSDFLGVLGVPGVEGSLTGFYTPPTSSYFHLRGVGALIDDLGRIIAAGTDGHEYLLTPTSLGTPQTVPEPSTLIVFGLVAAAILRRGYARSRT